ncbi:MAG: hypothetical protein IPP07_30260 [Holophagales bacterium]|nr:hypothetical protein [Holophagales bacterium]
MAIEFPVLFQEGGQVDLLSKPEVRLDGLPAELAAVVRRWQPPHLIPFKLETSRDEELAPGEELEELPAETKLFGVIVLPGSVSFLHKFFEAQLLVANGAPSGSGAVLSNVTAAIRLPAAVPRELLRLAETNPAVAPGQRVPVLGAGGAAQLGPMEQGMGASHSRASFPARTSLRWRSVRISNGRVATSCPSRGGSRRPWRSSTRDSTSRSIIPMSFAKGSRTPSTSP